MQQVDKLHFQVVCMDNRGYIIEHQNYTWRNHVKMLEYIQFMTTDARVNKVEVTRWNDKNERV